MTNIVGNTYRIVIIGMEDYSLKPESIKAYLEKNLEHEAGLFITILGNSSFLHGQELSKFMDLLWAIQISNIVVVVNPLDDYSKLSSISKMEIAFAKAYNIPIVDFVWYDEDFISIIQADISDKERNEEWKAEERNLDKFELIKRIQESIDKLHNRSNKISIHYSKEELYFFLLHTKALLDMTDAEGVSVKEE